MTTGTITDIQRFCIHDGPGIRTTVFLKGCQLRCFWCHNPEALRAAPELQVFPDKCIGCGACLEACPHGAHEATEGSKVFHRELCRGCGACARGCYAEGLVLVGREVTVDEVLDEVAQDAAFYRSSGGGVTLSGGEPICQCEFSRAVLERCRAEGIHTAIETNLAWPWADVASLLPFVDLVMFDLKAVDPALHREGTGAPNDRILDNARRLGETGMPLIARTPVIPGYNDTVEEIGAIARLAAGLPGLLYYELLPYHPLGTGKYESLGMEYRAEGLKPPSREAMEALAAAARSAGAPFKEAGRNPCPPPA